MRVGNVRSEELGESYLLGIEPALQETNTDLVREAAYPDTTCYGRVGNNPIVRSII
jgi:hypothetical protein